MIQLMLDEVRNSEIIIYDFRNKLGEWLFKKPLLLSLRTSGFRVYQSKANFFVEDNFYKAPLSKVFDFAIVFSSSAKPVPLTIFTKHEHVIELRRIDKFSEVLIYREKGKLVKENFFRDRLEQLRIGSITRYLGLTYTKENIPLEFPKNKVILLSFNVSDNHALRLDFEVDQIIDFIIWAKNNDYRIFFLEEAGLKRYRKIEQIKKVSHKVIRTRTIHEAFYAINECGFYFGVDSGLAHYAVRKGKISFVLYSKEFHGKKPIFNSDFSNHFTFFSGDKISEIIPVYLESLKQDRCFISSIRFQNEFLKGNNSLLENSYSNRIKFKKLVLALTLSSQEIKKYLFKIRDSAKNVFFIDKIYDFGYGGLKKIKGNIFIDSEVFTTSLYKLSRLVFKKELSNLSIFAKNSSFFYGTALKRGVSDIDLLTIHGSKIKKEKLKKFAEKLMATLKKNGFAVDLPHQVPIIGTAKTTDGFYPIIKKGKPVFSIRVPRDIENIEKYKSRIKLKVILGEISKIQINKILRKSTNEEFLGSEFTTEIKQLISNLNSVFICETFIRKMEYMLLKIGGFGSKGFVFLRVDKKEVLKISHILIKLMENGLVYLVGSRLYLNWDIRRPQHAWFIPIIVKWPRDFNPNQITKTALKSPIYNSSSFGILKKIYYSKIQSADLVKFLSSKSYLVSSEAFRKLSDFPEKIELINKLSKGDLDNFLNVNNSNCNEKDKKACLTSLISGKAFNLTKREISKLSKYNLFIQYLNGNSKFDIRSTSFFKINKISRQSTLNLSKNFPNEFLSLLREYYLYKNFNAPGFLLKEKEKEILFYYFVKGRSLMEGGGQQFINVRNFLSQINLRSLLIHQEAIESTLLEYHKIKPPVNKFSFLVTWVIKEYISHQDQFLIKT